MNRLIKYPKGTKIVVFSDLHLGHDRDFLLNPRGFDSVNRHKEWIFEQWAEHIDEDTVVFNLGDVCFNDAKGETFTEVSKLPCKEHLVVYGNHNSGLKQCYNEAVKDFFEDLCVTATAEFWAKPPEVYPLDFNNVTFVGNEVTVRVGRQEICLSHFGKRIWDHMSRGSWNLHGHSHGNDVGRNLEEPFQKALDVGVENAIKFNGTPFFTFDEIESIMATKTIKVLDHHDGTEAPS